MSEKEQLRAKAKVFRAEAQEHLAIGRRCLVDSQKEQHKRIAEHLLDEARECEHLARHS